MPNALIKLFDLLGVRRPTQWSWAILGVALLVSAGHAGAAPREVRVGIYPNAPKVLLGPDGQPSGIFGDMLAEIARDEGWTLRAVPCAWASCLQQLERGDIDLLPDLAFTEARAKVFDFGKVPALHSWSEIYHRPDTRITNVRDLAGRRVAVLSGSVQQTYLRELFEGYGITVELVPIDTVENAFELVARRGADAAVANQFFGDMNASRFSLESSPIIFQPARLYYGVARGRNHDLLDAIDRQLEAWKGDPKSPSTRILEKWTRGVAPASSLPGWIIWAGGALVAVLALALLVNAWLRHQIAEKTRHLELGRIELARHRDHLQELVDARTAELSALNVALAQRAEMVSDLYNRAPCGYHSLDKDGRVTSVNQTQLDMLGYSSQEVLGHDVREFVAPTSRPAFDEQLGRLKGGAGVRDHACEFVRKDGRLLPVLFSADASVDPAGSGGAVRATLVDNSERVKREKVIHEMQLELARRTRVAEQANAAKSIFLANISHEIRTPMNAIVGLSSLMRRDGLTPAQEPRLDSIDAASQHLLSIVNNVLDLSKIDAGQVQIETTDFHISAVLDAVHSIIADAARAKSLRLEIDRDDVPLWLSGDPTRLRQALLNLAANAVKFTERGRIALRVKLLEDRGAQLLLRFSVEDTGIGIGAEQASRLFQPFEQADASITRRFGGTGLGLVITKRLVELMGGRTGVDSEPGGGSTFWFDVPVGRGRAEPPSADVRSAPDIAARRRHRHRGARVLLAEDNEVNREVALAMLRGVGLEVDVATNGRQAVEMAKATAYRLILMDVQMPIISGLEATREIRSLAGWESRPILALTANAFDDDRQDCLSAGMTDFIAKPMEVATLFSALLKWLDHEASTVA